MREIRTSGSEGGGSKPIDTPYPYPLPTLPLQAGEGREGVRKTKRGGRDKPGHDTRQVKWLTTTGSIRVELFGNLGNAGLGAGLVAGRA